MDFVVNFIRNSLAVVGLLSTFIVLYGLTTIYPEHTFLQLVQYGFYDIIVIEYLFTMFGVSISSGFLITYMETWYNANKRS